MENKEEKKEIIQLSREMKIFLLKSVGRGYIEIEELKKELGIVQKVFRIGYE